MALKDLLTKKGFELMQDPRVQKVMADERVMKGMMKALQMRGEVQQKVDERVDQVAQSLNLATKKELRELKRGMRKMERELAKAKAQTAKAKEEAEAAKAAAAKVAGEEAAD